MTLLSPQPAGYIHVGMLWSCSRASGSPRYKMWSPCNTLRDLLGSRPSSSLALVPQQSAHKPRLLPKHYQPRRSLALNVLTTDKPRPPNPSTPHLSSTTPQVPTLILSHFKHMLFYMQSSLSSTPAANSFCRTVNFSDYLTRGFLALLSPPTAIISNYKT